MYHREKDFIDFDRERLIPHKLSQYGPGLAAGDIDGNGLMISVLVVRLILQESSCYNKKMENL
jgi:hypothetical protein